MHAYLNLVIESVILGWHVSNWKSAFWNQSSGHGLKARGLGVTAAVRAAIAAATVVTGSASFISVLGLFSSEGQLSYWAPSIGRFSNSRALYRSFLERFLNRKRDEKTCPVLETVDAPNDGRRLDSGECPSWLAEILRPKSGKLRVFGLGFAGRKQIWLTLPGGTLKWRRSFPERSPLVVTRTNVCI